MILITGGAGFLGKEVVKLLVAKQQKIRCLLRPGSNTRFFDQLIEIYPDVSMEIVLSSFNDLESLRRAVDGVDIVLHLAASKIGSAAAQVANTVIGSDNLFRICTQARIKRLVLCSSFGVIHAASVKRYHLIDETTPMEKHPEKRDPYSFTKQAQEKLAWRYYHQDGLPLCVIRPGVIFGPPESILSSRIGLTLFGMFLYLGGNNPIPLSYKLNCADAIVKAGLTPNINGEVFCVVDDHLPTAKQLLKRYRKEIGRLRMIPIPYPVLRFLSGLNAWYARATHDHLPAVFTPYKVDTMWKGHRFSNQKIKQMLNWEPIVSMEDALNITFRSMR